MTRRVQAGLPWGGIGCAVSIDRGGKEVVTPFAEKLGLRDLPLYLDPKSALARAFGIAGLAEWDSRAAVELVRYYLKKGGKGGVQDAGVGDQRECGQVSS